MAFLFLVQSIIEPAVEPDIVFLHLFLFRIGEREHAVKEWQKYVGKKEMLHGGNMFKSLTSTASRV